MTAILIALITAIIGPLVTYYLTIILPSRVYPPITRKSRAKLDGKWTGTGYQNDAPGGQPITPALSVKLKCGRRKIRGTATMHTRVGPTDYIITYSLEGIFFEDRVISFLYRVLNGNVRQFGSAVVMLDDSGRKLSGLLIGYGFLSEKIVQVKIELTKGG
jgi:hypothetical protein